MRCCCACHCRMPACASACALTVVPRGLLRRKEGAVPAVWARGLPPRGPDDVGGRDPAWAGRAHHVPPPTRSHQEGAWPFIAPTPLQPRSIPKRPQTPHEIESQLAASGAHKPVGGIWCAQASWRHLVRTSQLAASGAHSSHGVSACCML
jgi:hypothetical protein